MGYIWKALEEGFSEMYGLGGVPEPDSKTWPLPLIGWLFFLPVLFRFQTNCTATLPPLAGVLFFWGGGRGTPLVWGWVVQKILFWRRLGQCTRAKLWGGGMGQDITVDRIPPRVGKWPFYP